MRLKQLLDGVEYSTLNNRLLDKEISGIKINHREVKDGDVFIALRGVNFDGNDFIAQLTKENSYVVITDRKERSSNCVNVKNARKAYALMCKNYFNKACDDLKIIAVTGTNGKTTMCNAIADVLRTAGKQVGVIGTLGANYKGKTHETTLTTPDPYALHMLFAKMKKKGVNYVVMEASAHALALDKLEGIKFKVGVLTNITEDHLDYFGYMDRYAKAKFKLFDNKMIEKGIICVGKPYSQQLIEKTNVPVQTYGFDENANIKGEVVQSNLYGSVFTCDDSKNKTQYLTHLVGDYNMENALGVVAVCKALKIKEEDIKIGLSSSLPVEGRFNVIKTSLNNVIIDFAHTPDGLEKLLCSIKKLTDNKITLVFGCGGNRDKQKRPIMGEIAERYADKIILTNDNPRKENPYAIIEQIKNGMIKDCKVLLDRKEAIYHALSKARKGETIVIAGKGAEKFQEINGNKIPLNDFDIVCDYYKNKLPKKVFEDEDIENC